MFLAQCSFLKTETVKFDNTGADNTHLMKSMMLKATIRVTKDTT
jgi:hypothetical protein